MASWWQLDPRRTEPPASFELADYVRRALDTQVLARQREHGSWQVRQPLTLRQWLESGQPVTTADIDLHLSMIFPPVRPQGYLELRYLDAQPAGEWIAPLCLIAALFDSPDGIEQVLRCCAEDGRALAAGHRVRAGRSGVARVRRQAAGGRRRAVARARAARSAAGPGGAAVAAPARGRDQSRAGRVVGQASEDQEVAR